MYVYVEAKSSPQAGEPRICEVERIWEGGLVYLDAREN